MTTKTSVLTNTVRLKIHGAEGVGLAELHGSWESGLAFAVAKAEQLKSRAEVWYTYHPSDEVGSRKVHLVSAENSEAFQRVVRDGGREKFLLAVVEHMDWEIA